MKQLGKTAQFSTAISPQAKKALSAFCLKRGLKINHLLEEMIWDRLEEEMDAELAAKRDRRDLVDIKAIRKTAA